MVRSLSKSRGIAWHYSESFDFKVFLWVLPSSVISSIILDDFLGSEMRVPLYIFTLALRSPKSHVILSFNHSIKSIAPFHELHFKLKT